MRHTVCLKKNQNWWSSITLTVQCNEVKIMWLRLQIFTAWKYSLSFESLTLQSNMFAAKQLSVLFSGEWGEESQFIYFPNTLKVEKKRTLLSISWLVRENISTKRTSSVLSCRSDNPGIMMMMYSLRINHAVKKKVKSRKKLPHCKLSYSKSFL